MHSSPRMFFVPERSPRCAFSVFFCPTLVCGSSTAVLTPLYFLHVAPNVREILAVIFFLDVSSQNRMFLLGCFWMHLAGWFRSSSRACVA